MHTLCGDTFTTLEFNETYDEEHFVDVVTTV